MSVEYVPPVVYLEKRINPLLARLDSLVAIGVADTMQPILNETYMPHKIQCTNMAFQETSLNYVRFRIQWMRKSFMCRTMHGYLLQAIHREMAMLEQSANDAQARMMLLLQTIKT